MIAPKLIDVRALVGRIKARDETRDEIRCEAMSTSLESKKKEVLKLKNPQINNEDIEKVLIQLVGAVRKIGYLLKCLIMVLVFFGLTLVIGELCTSMSFNEIKKQENMFRLPAEYVMQMGNFFYSTKFRRFYSTKVYSAILLLYF